MDAAMEMAKRNGCTFFEVIGTNKYVTKICTRREFTLVKSIKYEGIGVTFFVNYFFTLVGLTGPFSEPVWTPDCRLTDDSALKSDFLWIILYLQKFTI